MFWDLVNVWDLVDVLGFGRCFGILFLIFQLYFNFGIVYFLILALYF